MQTDEGFKVRIVSRLLSSVRTSRAQAEPEERVQYTSCHLDDAAECATDPPQCPHRSRVSRLAAAEEHCWDCNAHSWVTATVPTTSGRWLTR